MDRMAACADPLSVVVSCTLRERGEMKIDREVKVSPAYEQARASRAAQVIDLARRMLRERLSAPNDLTTRRLTTYRLTSYRLTTCRFTCGGSAAHLTCGGSAAHLNGLLSGV